MTTVGIAIPTFEERFELRQRALASVYNQERKPEQVVVEFDHDRQGAAATRNRAWRKLETDWVAFLDDDDELLPNHLAVLMAAAAETEADLFFPWFELPVGKHILNVGGEDPEGRPFDDRAREHLLTVANFVPITVLVRRSALEAVDGFPQPLSTRWPLGHAEDWGCWQDLLRAGFRFHHVPVRTWRWHWHPGSTAGLAVYR